MGLGRQAFNIDATWVNPRRPCRHYLKATVVERIERWGVMQAAWQVLRLRSSQSAAIYFAQHDEFVPGLKKSKGARATAAGGPHPATSKLGTLFRRSLSRCGPPGDGAL